MGGNARTRLGLGAALALVIAMVASITGGPAGAVLPGVIDISVSIASRPTTVSPPGELVLYRVAVSNVGVIETSSDVTVDLPAGAAYRDDLSSPNCDAAGDDVQCTVPSLSATQKHAFDVVAHTPVVAGTYTATATVTARDVVEPLEYQQNNTASANTKVEAPNGQIAAGLVEEGDTLSLDVGDGRKYELTVPEGVPGVIVERLVPHSGTGKVCGAGACGAGFLLQFVEGHPIFKAEDPNNPLVTRRTFGPQDPCKGLGTCAEIYFAKDPDTIILAPMQNCPGASGSTPGDGTANPSPCINHRYKVGGIIHWEVRLLSNDPLEVPPLLSKLSG